MYICIIDVSDQGDSLLELPGTLKNSSSHTSLSSADVYREFESAEPLHLTFNNKQASPAGSVELLPHDVTDSTTHPPPSISIDNSVLTEDMTTALVGMVLLISSRYGVVDI